MNNETDISKSENDTKLVSKEGWFSGKRGSNNALRLAFFSLVGIGIGIPAYFHEPVEIPNDSEHAGFLKEQYGKAIKTAVENPGKVHSEIPAHFKKSANLLEEYTNTKPALEKTRFEGDRSIDAQRQYKKNEARLTDAQDSFTHWNGGLVISATECESIDPTTFSCEMKRTEIGGFDSNDHQMKACFKDSVNFTVTMDDGEILTIQTKGKNNGYSVGLSRSGDGEKNPVHLNSRLGERLGVERSELKKFENVIQEFSMCYDYDQQ